jgi:hypothetical protein
VDRGNSENMGARMGFGDEESGFKWEQYRRPNKDMG